ncbi:MAG: ParB N-terminal domain-containing protein [Anaerolineae bacterium]
MAKKRTSLSQTLFGEINPYGEEASPPSEPIAGPPTTFLLDVIRPDVSQPRQLLPPDLSRAVAQGEIIPAEALNRWLAQAEAANADPGLKYNVTELRRLAASIKQHGLINPITLRRPGPRETVPSGVEYLIVTGERRYWSHVLLSLEGRQIREGNIVSSPEQIKAVLTNEGVSVRAHQLIENLMREDINGVEKARGLWALRYELSGVNHGSPAVDTPEEKLIPWSQVEEVVNISKRYRIFITSVLNLTLEAQQLVTRHNLSERLIRPVVQKLKEQPELQLEALQQLIAWRARETGEPEQPVTDLAQELVERLLARAASSDAAEGSLTSRPPLRRSQRDAEAFRNRVQGALRFLNKLEEPDLAGLTQDLATAQEYADVVENLRDLRERIDTILEAVSIYAQSRS